MSKLLKAAAKDTERLSGDYCGAVAWWDNERSREAEAALKQIRKELAEALTILDWVLKHEDDQEAT